MDHKAGKESEMIEQSSLDKILDVIAAVLIRCFAVGIAFLTISVVWVMSVPDGAWQMHSNLFHLSHEQVALAIYQGVVAAKIGIFGFFLLPYIGIRWVLRKRNGEPSNK